MHGRARVSVQHQHSDAGAKEAAKDKRRAAQYAEQLAEVLRSNQEKDYGKEAVEKSAALLKTNPDMYTAWNYRCVLMAGWLQAVHSTVPETLI